MAAGLGAGLLSDLLAPEPARAQQTARDRRRVDRLLCGNSSRGRFTMEIVTRHWSRSIEIRVWSLGTDYALARVLAPPKETGTATLKVQSKVWN